MRMASELPVALARGRARFEEWRRTRSERRIPDSLWTLAARLAAEHGVQRTADALRLNPQSLRGRMTSPRRGGEGKRDEPKFVELGPLPVASSWAVEMTAVNGAQLRIEARGQTLDIVSLVRSVMGDS